MRPPAARLRITGTSATGLRRDGQTVEHTYAAGRWTATLTSRSADGTTETATTSVTAYGLTLTGPNPARYGRKVVLRGAIVPGERNLAVELAGPRGKIATTRTRADGTYLVRARIRAPGSYTATSEQAAAAPLALRVVPKLVTGFAGSSARGSAYYFTAHLVPAAAGTLALKVARGQDVILDRTFGSRVRIKLDTKRLTKYRITHRGRAERGLRRNRPVAARERRPAAARARRSEHRRRTARRPAAPAALRGALRARASTAACSTPYMHSRRCTGSRGREPSTPAFGRRSANPRQPRTEVREPAAHIEVNKGLQVLYVVRGSKIALIVPISTAGIAGAFTPVGRFAVYRKVGGFDPSPLGTLYDPLYFTGGYAIHGNPSVPPYPASHGCVRVPMWVAPQLYQTIPYGETVYVY